MMQDVYELSHGDLRMASVGNGYKDWELNPSTIKLKYRMGIGLFFSCGSNRAEFWRLVNKRGVFAGWTVGENHHPEVDEVQAKNYISIPDQGTE